MEATFKKQIIKQLDKLIKDLEDLLKIEGNLSDLRELPSDLANHVNQDIAYFNQCKQDINNGRPPRPRLPWGSRVNYARPDLEME